MLPVKLMLEFIVIVESSADARTATKLAERIIVENVDWLEPDNLQHFFRWSGLEEPAGHSCWKDIRDIIERAKILGLRIPKFLGHNQTRQLKADGAATKKIITLVEFLCHKKSRQVGAVLLIRDIDNQPARVEGIKQVRSEPNGQQPKFEIIIGIANRMREAWVLNGFIPSNSKENQCLEEIKTKLKFDPCKEAHKLRSNLWEEPDRARNPKVVLNKLTGGDSVREQQCWEETSLKILRSKGTDTGLTAYLHEVEHRLVPIIRNPNRHSS